MNLPRRPATDVPRLSVLPGRSRRPTGTYNPAASRVPAGGPSKTMASVDAATTAMTQIDNPPPPSTSKPKAAPQPSQAPRGGTFASRTQVFGGSRTRAPGPDEGYSLDDPELVEAMRRASLDSTSPGQPRASTVPSPSRAPNPAGNTGFPVSGSARGPPPASGRAPRSHDPAPSRAPAPSTASNSVAPAAASQAPRSAQVPTSTAFKVYYPAPGLSEALASSRVPRLTQAPKPQPGPAKAPTGNH